MKEKYSRRRTKSWKIMQIVIKRIVGWLVLIFFFVILVYSVYKKYQLKHNYVLTNATINAAGVRMQKNGSWLILYSYSTSTGKQLTGKGLYFIFFERKDSLVGRVIPCAYFKEEPRRSELLIYEETWNQYGLKYPDSLMWTKYFFKPIIFSH